MFKTRTRRNTLAAAVVTAAVAVAMSGCSASSGGGGGDGKTLTVWQFETKGSAQYDSYQDAVKTFEKANPKVKVTVVNTSFNSVRQNAKLLLTGKNIPDVMEVNKGNADAGQLAAQGLLTNLNSEVKKYGWDKTVTGSMQKLAKYDSSGNASTGDWFGIPTSGQDYLFYYNKDLFAKAGLQVPTTQAQFDSDLASFTAKGQVPISSNAGEFGLAQLWYQFVSATATRKQIDNYMFLKGSTDFSKAPWSTASQQLETWLNKGYLGTNLSALTQAQMETAFISGKYPIMGDGSWEFTGVKTAAKFNWGTFLYPGSAFNEGLTGQLLTVPSGAKNKDLAYEFINDTLKSSAQNVLGKEGGLPLKSDLSVISDPQTKAFTEQFNSLKADDKLTYFPDYPVTGLLAFLESEMQGMANGNKTAAEFDKDLQSFYDKGKSQAANS
jgi:raffinose/stachyose/melibiose transport system substrate-binding protein